MVSLQNGKMAEKGTIEGGSTLHHPVDLITYNWLLSNSHSSTDRCKPFGTLTILIKSWFDSLLVLWQIAAILLFRFNLYYPLPHSKDFSHRGLCLFGSNWRPQTKSRVPAPEYYSDFVAEWWVPWTPNPRVESSNPRPPLSTKKL